MCLYLRVARKFIKLIPRKSRYQRLIFVGRRLKVIQNGLLDYNSHPHEKPMKE